MISSGEEGATREPSDSADAASRASPGGAGGEDGPPPDAGPPVAPGGRKLVLDRWEGDVAVLEEESGGTVDLPRWILPHGAGEGAVVVVRTSGSGAEARVELTLDAEASERARSEAAEILERLRKRDPGGDLAL